MIREVQALVVGAGPSGLSAALALQGSTLVVEQAGRVGGLCRSIGYRGGIFDIGGHSFHTPHAEVADLVQEMLGEDLFRQRRDARVHHAGDLIPYPFQEHFRQLSDPATVRRCAEGLDDAPRTDRSGPRNLEEFIVGRFGRGIADAFLLPYNRKLWARDLSSVSPEWTNERVAAPGEDKGFARNGTRRGPLASDTVVGYPARGGFEEIYRSFVPHVPAVELRRKVIQVDTDKRIAVTADGSRYAWTFLISTIPLPLLIRTIAGVPSDIRALADRLEHLPLRVELLLAGRPIESLAQRIYVADPEVHAHKIALNHNSSVRLRSRPRHAITAEVSYGAEKPLDPNAIAPGVIDFLCQIDILEDPADILWTGHVDVPYAYPVPTRDAPETVAVLKEWLARRHVYTLGRFGEWKYDNSDACVAGGLALGRALRQVYRERPADQGLWVR